MKFHPGFNFIFFYFVLKLNVQPLRIAVQLISGVKITIALPHFTS